MKNLIITLLLLNCTLAFTLTNDHKEHPHCKSRKTRADKHAWAKANSIPSFVGSQAIWPYTITSIGHSMQSYQNYGSPYWHDGLDIRGEALTNVHSTVDGKVVNIEKYGRSDLYWEVAILDDNGFVWKYHHVDKNSIPQEIHDKYKNGGRVKQGDFIGKIVKWPVWSHGEYFHHIHLLIVDGNGHYINPFSMLPKLDDTNAPVIKKIGIFKNLKPIRRDKVRGPHGIYIEAYDTIFNKDYLLTPYIIKYKLDNATEKVVWKFDRLPNPKSDLTYISQFYLKGTCGDYSCRKFILDLNFDPKSKNATKYFDLNKGEHSITVTVEDFIGNSSTKPFNYIVL